ncbi:MAG TPA: hypothetical protein VGG03_05570 [Thermoanaerobaculia bacterium]|jgi:hypothetical protein
MVRSTAARTVALLVLCFIVAAPLTAAAAPLAGNGPAGTYRSAGGADFLGWLWSAWTSVWVKNGCQVDPFGRCLKAATSTAGSTKNGCQVDPNGHCLKPTPSTKNGCHIDPDGRCVP